MIECPNCNISFKPSHAVCPRCKKFETPIQARKAYLEELAENRIMDGDNPEDVRTDLLANGFSDVEADDLIIRETSALARENRGYGILRLAAGIVMAVVGGVAIIFALLTLGENAPVRLSGRAFATMVIFGAGMSGTGLLAILSGGISTLTGKTPGNRS